ncbi:hypothetical protein BDQ94DRAFT_148997 [Aspergillus welwitschiae]|uniref:Uncharacterized protein n=1 Tax=Aspergillus welwitschiae TaxID=1341132 RepID=A0A3F3PU05_9EURO|nr:hypothetical protein BDQ94DRAFT_148997 [Aspergillus welwitschiae]RDH30414.1 hypothetical protein BDQ94DRAFT_148997 [Aspergillus welwitschiae]
MSEYCVDCRGWERSCLWSWQTGPHRGAGWNGRNCNPFRTIHLSHDPLELESNPPSFSSPPVGGLPADPQTLKRASARLLASQPASISTRQLDAQHGR